MKSQVFTDNNANTVIRNTKKHRNGIIDASKTMFNFATMLMQLPESSLTLRCLSSTRLCHHLASLTRRHVCL